MGSKPNWKWHYGLKTDMGSSKIFWGSMPQTPLLSCTFCILSAHKCGVHTLCPGIDGVLATRLGLINPVANGICMLCVPWQNMKLVVWCLFRLTHWWSNISKPTNFQAGYLWWPCSMITSMYIKMPICFKNLLSLKHCVWVHSFSTSWHGQ